LFSNYRYPGKINLNTIPNQQVYNALMKDYAGQLNFGNFNNARWKQAGAAQFFRPFRNSQEGNLVPRLARPGFPADSLLEENVDCGLYRRARVSDPVSMFDFRDTTVSRNTERNAYFKNEMRQRLGNLVTTRSSVFAIWVTVGYFEVDPATGILKNIAGGGLELGSDTGEVQRNRAFYIVDRSVPVAFEPGKNHNVDRAVLVKSVIE
jgi:hypothetical protein